MKSQGKNIISKLIRKKLKISFAESCTGGLLSNVITSVSGSSKVFSVGLITYSNLSKINLLKVPKKTIIKYGAVSEQVCIAMLKNVSKIGKTSMSAAVTGIAGPGGGSKKKPVGMVYIGVKKNNKIKVKKYLFKNNGRHYIQKSAANKCIELILATIK
tara:strand:- start:1629 stop:2102 length:474 start_codon:yes stop_codon:yes gene_type:complete